MLAWVLSWVKLCICTTLLVLGTARMLDGIHLALGISFSSRDGVKGWKLMEEFWESWCLNPALSLWVHLA